VDANVTGTLNVLNASRLREVEKVVHTSTSEVYGTAQYVPIDEEHPMQGQSPYSATKIGADKIAESYFCSFDLPVVTVRPFNTYGPRQSARAIIPTIITQALQSDSISLGNLRPTRDFNYVADTIAGFLALANCEGAVGHAINLGSGREISIGDVAKLICEIVGRELVIDTDQERLRPENSEVDRLCADISRVSALTDWRPNWSLRQGLEETVVWMEKNVSRYRIGEYAK
jgi:dTDP-glucose 4,6-dehydratase